MSTSSPTPATEKAATEVRPAIVYLQEKVSGYVADQDGQFFGDGAPSP